ncbi:MAG: PEP-CTERM sorting domain-containing protein [Verrucomicrobiae bacterium]|nr:PEP-CTERM sorting domain-containing protein [Verrucomicrobiae bacterium]
MKRTFLAVVTALLTVSALSSHASIVWVGTTSSDVFDESNWDLSGSLVTTIDENVSIEDDVFIGAGPFSNAPVIPDLAGQVRFQLADAKMLTLDGGSLVAAGNDGVGGAPGTVNGPAIAILGGGSFNPFFIVNGVSLTIDGASSATMNGGGNPINLSTVDLAPGATFTFGGETPEAFTAEHLSKFSVNGAPAVIDGNIKLVSDGAIGSIVTAVAVPEPSSAVLLTLAGLGVLIRRRR